MGKTKRLDNVFSSYDVVVFDTCAIRTYMPEDIRDAPNEKMGFYLTLTERLKLGSIGILPEDILEEIARVGAVNDYEKTVKKNLLGAACRMASKINKITKRASGTNISDQVDREIAKDFSLYKHTGASREDLSVFEYAKLYHEIGISSAIVSNDMRGLYRVWDKYTERNNISSSKLGFLHRAGPDKFNLHDAKVDRK